MKIEEIREKIKRNISQSEDWYWSIDEKNENRWDLSPVVFGEVDEGGNQKLTYLHSMDGSLFVVNPHKKPAPTSSTLRVTF